MRQLAFTALAIGMLASNALRAMAADGENGFTYHASPDRSGHFVVAGLTWARAASARLDPAFDARADGAVYAQPLYWRSPGTAHGLLIVATETNTVHALDAASGREVWRRTLGTPARQAELPCGNISPLGITGTQVIDPRSRTVYLNAMVSESGAAQHLVFGLSLDDGSVRPGWPIGIAAGLRAISVPIDTNAQNQRGALALVGEHLYVPFGGHFGDCGNYHGMLVGLRVDTPQVVAAWTTRAPKGGIWAPGGISSDARALFVATGNTRGAHEWGDGEAVIRVGPGLQHSNDTRDYFAPANWRELDEADADLGGVAPLPIDVPSGQGVTPLLVALGKDGKAYVLDRDNLGGIGGALVVERVAAQEIITAPAAYRIGDAAYVAFQGQRLLCPERSEGASLAVLRITAGARPEMRVAWCGVFEGRGAPSVTTSDGGSDPIVWIVGAEGDGRLHGFRGDTGQPVFDGGQMAGTRRFATILAAEGRLYVAGDGRVYAFEFAGGT
jgi:outer membrane protein assembly factor BamB